MACSVWSEVDVILGWLNHHYWIALMYSHVGKRIAICIVDLHKLSAASGRPCQYSIEISHWPTIIVDFPWVSNSSYMPQLCSIGLLLQPRPKH